MKTIKNIDSHHLENSSLHKEDLELLNYISIKKSTEEASISKELIRTRVMNRIESSNVHALSTWKNNFYVWRAIAAIFIVALIIGSGIFGYKALDNRQISDLSIQQLSNNVPNGAISSVTLPDGSEVTLNSGTKLTYPSVFNNKERIVELDGEAIFKIAKRKNQPFIVRTNHLNVRVLGTVFNLKAYKVDDKVILTLAEGKVKAESKYNNHREEILLMPNQQIQLNTNNGEMTMNEVDALRFFSWKDGEMYFQNNTLEEISKVLARQFNTHISFGDESIKRELYFCQFSKKDSIEKILELLSQSSNWSYEIKGNKFLLNRRSAYQKNNVRQQKRIYY